VKRRRHVVIKGSSLPVLRIVVRDADLSSVRSEIAGTVENARQMLSEAIAVLDLRERRASEVGARDIVVAVRDAGVRLAAVLIGDGNERARLADLELPVIEAPLPTKDRASRNEPEQAPPSEPPVTSTERSIEASAEASAEAKSGQSTSGQPGEPDIAPVYLTRPLRSGQRFYAQGRDVVVTAPTSRGSELIADGSIYAFSPIRGRVLAGASGNTSACIVATDLDAELVAVAGVYRTLEAGDLQALGSGPVSLALSVGANGSERLTLAPLAPSSHMQRR
jgi:septum site-determining protein MinC